MNEKPQQGHLVVHHRGQGQQVGRVEGQGHGTGSTERQQPGAGLPPDEQERPQHGRAGAETVEDGDRGVGVRAGDQQPPPRGVGQDGVGAPNDDLVDLFVAQRRGGAHQLVVTAGLEDQHPVDQPRGQGQDQTGREQPALDVQGPQVEPADGYAGEQVGQVRDRRVGAGEQHLGQHGAGVGEHPGDRGIVGLHRRQHPAQGQHQHGGEHGAHPGEDEQGAGGQVQEGDGQQEEHPVVEQDVVGGRVLGHQNLVDEQTQHGDQHGPDEQPHPIGGHRPAPMGCAPAGGERQADPGQQGKQGRGAPGEQLPLQGGLIGLRVPGGQNVDGKHPQQGQTPSGVDPHQPWLLHQRED